MVVGMPAKLFRGRVISLILILLLVFFLLYKVKEVLVPFFWAGFLAYLLIRPVRYLEECGISRSLAIFLIYLVVGGTLILVITFLLPTFLRELDTLMDYIPRYINYYQSWLKGIQYNYQYILLPETVRLAINQTLTRTEEYMVTTLGDILENFIRGYNTLLILVFAPFLSYYFLRDVELIKRRLISILPVQWRRDILFLLSEIDRVLLGFIRGNLLLCVIVGMMTVVGLKILGVNFALLLGLFAGIADLVPYFGPFIGALPAVGVALLESPRLAFYVVGIIFIIQQLEVQMIGPKILGESVGLHPLVVVFFLLAGGKLWGIIGLLIAVPLAAVIKIILNYIYLKCLED